MVSRTPLTTSGAASVRTPTSPIGQSEFSMSMVCLARKPGGVLMLIFTPSSTVTDDADGVAQLHVTTATTASEAAACRRARARYALAPDPATSNTTSNSSSEAPVATGFARCPA